MKGLKHNMHAQDSRLRNESGFVLVAALLFLAILSLIGVAGLTTSIFEKEVAGNDWGAKRNFYQADGGTELASEALTYNLIDFCTLNRPRITSKISVRTPNIWSLPPPAAAARRPSDTNRELCVPAGDCGIGSSTEHTNIRVFGSSQGGEYAPGNSTEMVDDDGPSILDKSFSVSCREIYMRT